MGNDLECAYLGVRLTRENRPSKWFWNKEWAYSYQCQYLHLLGIAGAIMYRLPQLRFYTVEQVKTPTRFNK